LRIDDPGRRRSTLCRNGLSATSQAYVAWGAGEGDAGGGDGADDGEGLGLGRIDGSEVGSTDGVALGEDDGDALGVGFEQSWFCVPWR
jgi:hypothetical protein